MNWSPRSKWIFVYCVLGALFVLVVYMYHSLLWREAVHFYSVLHRPRRLKEFILSFGAYAPLVFVSIQLVQVVVAPIPGGPIEFLGGYLFGVKAGFLYSMVGLILGSMSAFGLARIFEVWAVEKIVSLENRKKFEYLFGHEGAILSFLLFLIPIFPKDALCYILGLTPMRLGIFFAISTIGRIPGTLMATLQGAKAFDQQYKGLFVLLGISAFIVLICYIYHEKIHDTIKRLKAK